MTGAELFDVVVVGGGAAGCVVASRLSEAGSRSVLLLEAGPDLRAPLPEKLRDGWHITGQFDWGYRSEPDELGAVQPLRRGKLLGGTAWYTRFALRGAAEGYDEWEALGNTGWGFDHVLPFLKGIESDLDFGHQPWHGDSGPIPVTRYPELEPTEIGAATLRAFEGVGFLPVDDHNRPGAVGFGRMPMSSRQGARVTTAQAYLPPDGSRPGLAVRPDAEVAEISFDGTQATGLRLLDGTTIRAGCVVLSAGTYGSPSILLRSGIGPEDHLRSVGIPARVALAGVGENLGADCGVDVDCGYRGGAREAPAFCYAATFRSSEGSSDSPPDLMLWAADPYNNPPVFTIDVVLLRPRSRGRLRLRSSDPAAPPRIELRSFTEPTDLVRLVEGYRRAFEVAINPEIRRLCPNPPGPEPREGRELMRSVRENAYPMPHVFGTCSMGPSAEEGAVVDESGRVYGTERLFVVDASIMPTVPSGFTHMPTIMIAERLAEKIATRL